MRVLSAIAGAAIAASLATSAAAATITTTVSATGAYNGALSVVNDGVFPANGSNYDSVQNVTFGAGFGGTPAVFTFNFARSILDGFLATVDNNDKYIFEFFDGATLVNTASILGSEGSVGWGVETFSRSLSNFAATSVRVSTSAGDGRASLGEFQLTGTAVPVSGAVPEPATWAMMLLGFIGLGGAVRRRRAAQPTFA